MAAGNDLIARVIDLVPEMGDNTGTLSAAEESRLLRNFNAELDKVIGALASIGEDYQLASSTFDTVANRSPNRYGLPADFKDIRYLEIILDDAAGAYERIPPIPHIADKDWSLTYVWPDLIINGAQGRPAGYLLGSDFIQIEPICDDIYPMRIWYTFRYIPIVADDVEIRLPPELYDALVYGAAAREKEFRREMQDAQAFFMKAELFRSGGLSNLETRRDDGPQLIHYISEGYV